MAGYDLQMIQLVVQNILDFKPQNIFEIGSRDGHDTQYLKDVLNIDDSNCYIFEAHPHCYKQIKEQYKTFNTYHCAITNETKQVEFNAGLVGLENCIGCSSMLQEAAHRSFKSEKVIVDGWRFSDIYKHLNLTNIDLVKMDVEGHAMEVLEGFGDILNEVKLLQLELEHKEAWVNQKLYPDVAEFLINNNFEQLVFIRTGHDQSDSVWVNKQHTNIQLC